MSYTPFHHESVSAASAKVRWRYTLSSWRGRTSGCDRRDLLEMAASTLTRISAVRCGVAVIRSEGGASPPDVANRDKVVSAVHVTVSGRSSWLLRGRPRAAPWPFRTVSCGPAVSATSTFLPGRRLRQMIVGSLLHHD